MRWRQFRTIGVRQASGIVAPGTHLLAAFSARLQGVIGQLRVAPETNEITAALELLKNLPLKGVTITADAIWSAPPDLRCAETIEKSHGRIETRRIETPASISKHLASDWTGVGQVCRITRERIVRGKKTIETVYDHQSYRGAGWPGPIAGAVASTLGDR
jgi:hypothetical protein